LFFAAMLLLSVSCAWAQAPLVLRGIVLTHSGEGRAYFEDPHTGVLAPYAVGDTVGDNRIEEIQDEYVILRRGDHLIRMVMGSAPMTVVADRVSRVSPPPALPFPVYRPNPTQGPTIGNGQPWLDRLGIPPQALSRAIEEALPAQDSDAENTKD
jgi:hypothetical protein